MTASCESPVRTYERFTVTYTLLNNLQDFLAVRLVWTPEHAQAGGSPTRLRPRPLGGTGKGRGRIVRRAQSGVSPTSVGACSSRMALLSTWLVIQGHRWGVKIGSGQRHWVCAFWYRFYPTHLLLCDLGKLLHLWASILSKTVNNISWLVTRINELVHDTDKNRPRHMALTIAVYNPQQKITFTQCTPQSTL